MEISRINAVEPANINKKVSFGSIVKMGARINGELVSQSENNQGTMVSIARNFTDGVNNNPKFASIVRMLRHFIDDFNGFNSIRDTRDVFEIRKGKRIKKHKTIERFLATGKERGDANDGGKEIGKYTYSEVGDTFARREKAEVERMFVHDNNRYQDDIVACIPDVRQTGTKNEIVGAYLLRRDIKNDKLISYYAGVGENTPIYETTAKLSEFGKKPQIVPVRPKVATTKTTQQAIKQKTQGEFDFASQVENAQREKEASAARERARWDH